MLNLKYKIFLSIVIIFGGVGCQKTTSFSSRTGSTPEPPATADVQEAPPTPEAPSSPPAPKPEHLKLTWDFPCHEEEISQSEQITEIRGNGDFDIPWDLISEEVGLTFSGKFCPPRDTQRDIVFVVDVSGSMLDNDPIINNSCGRLDAVRKMMESAGEKTNYAIVTFSETILFTSSNFHNTKEGLLNELGGEDTAYQVVCNAQASTFYDIALDSAATLYASSDVNSAKELFFISDGAPSNGHEGIESALALKDDDVTIAAIMLKGSDLILKDKIASQDINGKPLFAKVSKPAKLADIFRSLAEKSRVGVITAEIGFKSFDETEFQILDIKSHIEDSQFQIPEISISKDLIDVGLDVYYKFKMKDGSEHLQDSTITAS